MTLWTIAHQDPLSMGFSRQEYWSGLPISFSILTYFKMIPFLLPLPEAWGLFLWYLHENLVKLLKVNHKILCASPPPSPSSPEVFNSQSCPHWASNNSSIIVQVFLTWYWFPRESLLVNLCFDKPWLYFPICLSSLGTNGLPCVLSILRYLSCWLFSLFSFLFVVTTEWWFPSF